MSGNLLSQLLSLVRPLVSRPLRRDLLRSGLTIAGIAVGVATMTAILLANASVLSSFRESVDLIAGKASLTILPEGPGIPEDVLTRLEWLRDDGAAVVPAVTATAYASGSSSRPDVAEIVDVLGIDPMADGSARTYRQGGTSTEQPDLFAIFRPGTLLLPSPLAARLGARLGDEVALTSGGVTRRLRVGGVLAAEGAARAASSSMAFADLATVQEAFGKVGRLDRIDVVLPPDAAASAEAVLRYQEEIQASLPSGVSVGRPERRTATVDRMLRAFRVNLVALSSIALAVGLYFVYNTLAISVLRRRADIGTVRALGASRSAVFLVFLGEALLLGLLGSGAGVLLGIALARGALLAVGGTAVSYYLPSARPSLDLDPRLLLATFLIGLAGAVLSAVAPALEAAAVPPAASMRRGSVEISRRGAVRPLAAGGIVSLLLAALVTRAEPIDGLPLFGFLAVFLVVLGASLLTPLFLTGFAGAFGRGRGGSGGSLLATIRIARADLLGSLSRTSVAVAALSMAISMMVAVAVMVGSFRTTVLLWLDQTLAGDVFISPAGKGASRGPLGRIPQRTVDALARLPELAAIEPFLAFGAVSEGRPYTIGGGDFEFLARSGRFPLVGGGAPSTVLLEAKARGEALVSEPYATKFRVKVGDRIDLPAVSGTASVRVAAVYFDYSNDRGTVTLDRALFRRLFAQEGASTISAKLAPGIAFGAARSAVVAVAGDVALEVRSHGDLRKAALSIFDRTFAVTYALEAMAIVVACLGATSTLLALVLERRREIGLLRVLGASIAHVANAVRLEALAISSLSSLIGLASGGAISWILIHVINKQSFGWTIDTHWPWGFLALSLSVVIATTVLSSHHPGRIAAATDPHEALIEE